MLFATLRAALNFLRPSVFRICILQSRFRIKRTSLTRRVEISATCVTQPGTYVVRLRNSAWYLASDGIAADEFAEVAFFAVGRFVLIDKGQVRVIELLKEIVP